MTEDPKTSDDQTEAESTEQTEPTDSAEQTAPEPIVEKQMIDKPSDFRFHAAYVTYSDIFDKTQSSNDKQKLNEAITILAEDKIDYETFYRQISQYRGHAGPDQFSGGRAFIETQRKRDWRRREERDSRNKRHGR
jgi:histone deacetylase complex regulatory component SIN3